MQIARGLYSLGDNSGGYVRAFLVDDGAGLTLIDTLLDKNGTLVRDELRRIGKQPSDIKCIVLTHADQSHLGGLAALKQATGAIVYSHEWEVDVIEGRRKQGVDHAANVGDRGLSLSRQLLQERVGRVRVMVE